MKKSKVLNWLLEPPLWFLFVIYPITVAAISAAMIILALEYIGVVTYVLYALAGITLSYTVYTIVRFSPKIKSGVILIFERYEFTRSLINNFGFRTLVFAVVSLTLSVAYGIFNGVIALISISVWYAALALYYVLMALLRGRIIFFHSRRRKGKYAEKTEAEIEIKKIETYRNSGVLIMILHLALPAAIAGMVISDKSFAYAGLMIYASAAYAFFKITMSIVNIFKARRQDDMTVTAVRNINLADAMVSILALQTALLDTFGGGSVNDIFNILTGAVVSLATLALGIIMTVQGSKKIKEYKNAE